MRSKSSQLPVYCLPCVVVCSLMPTQSPPPIIGGGLVQFLSLINVSPVAQSVFPEQLETGLQSDHAPFAETELSLKPTLML